MVVGRIAVPARVVKWLYAASGNQCAFTGCRRRLVEPLPDGDDVVVASDVAHIVAATPSGPRGESDLSAEDRSRSANLILLCQMHHRVVDQDRDRYSPGVLREMKNRHADRVCARNGSESAVPRTLPRAAHGFVGRGKEIDTAISTLKRATTIDNAGDAGDAGLPAVVITGAPGIGKTALAVQMAHLAADMFPDGQVFLGSQDGSGWTTGRLMDELSVAVGGGAPEASAPYRERLGRLREALAGRNVLVVVDDVSAEDALRDLVSIGCGLAVICTSRSRLSGLADSGAAIVELGRLPDGDAASLAVVIAGAERLTEAEAAALAAVCGGHPLAIRVAASRLATRPYLDVTSYLRKIADPGKGLAALSAGERTVVEVIEDSYRTLGEDQAALIRLLGQLPNVSLPVDVVAAARVEDPDDFGARDVDGVETLLDSLFELNLVEQAGFDSYRLHDMLHRFARAKKETPGLSGVVVQKACLAFVARLHAANQQVGPVSDVAGPAAGAPLAMAQLERDRHSGVAMLEAATDEELWEAVAVLSSALAPVLILRGLWRDIQRVSRCLMVAGERTGNKEWLASATHNLGVSADHLGDPEGAIEFYRRSEALARLSDDLVMAQAARESYGCLLLHSGQFTDAVRYFKHSIRVWRTLNRDKDLARTLCTLGECYILIGDWRRAEQYLVNGRQVAERAGAVRLYTNFGLALSGLYRHTGRAQRAHDECRAALDAARSVADRYREALALLELGVVRQLREIPDSATEPLQAALELFRAMEDKVGEVKALHMLANCRRRAGDITSAAELLDACYELALRLGAATEAALCLADQATLLGDIGRVRDALEMFQLAEDIAADTGSRAVLAQVRHSHALLLVLLGQYQAATALLRKAGSLLRDTGRSDLRANVQICLADALMNDGQPLAAASVLDPIVNAPAESIGDGTRATAHRILAILCSRRRLPAEANRSIQQALSLARACCDQEEEMHCLGTLGNILARGGRWSDAAVAYDSAAHIATRRNDFRFLLVVRTNRLACRSHIDAKVTTGDILNECEQVLDLARQLGLVEIELGLCLNKGGWLADAGHIDEAIGTFQEAHALATSVSNAGHLAAAKTSLARALLTKGQREQSRSLAHDARKLYESRQDWVGAAGALAVQIQSTATENTWASAQSVNDLIDPNWSVRGHVIAALHSALKTGSSPDDFASTASPGRRAIVVAEDVRNLLTDVGVDTDSLVAFYAESRHECVACGLPIANDGTAELVAQAPKADGPTVTRLAHKTCAPSAVVAFPLHAARQQDVNFEIECALLGNNDHIPAIVVDCYGGWGAGPDGKMVDLLLDTLRHVGFEQVTSQLAVGGITTVKVPDEASALQGRLTGNHLTLHGNRIESLLGDIELQFRSVWYQAAAQRECLVVMFGRHLQGMSWEDSSYIRRAADAGRLVATAATLRVVPPGRNTPCVCTPPTGLKFKRCCGRPEPA